MNFLYLWNASDGWFWYLHCIEMHFNIWNWEPLLYIHTDWYRTAFWCTGDWEPPLYSHIKIGSWYQIGVLPGIEIHFDNNPNLVYLDWLFPCIKVVSKATLLHQNSCFSCFFHLFLHIQASPSCFHNPWIFALPCTHIPAHVILFLLHSSLNVNIDLQFGLNIYLS